MQKNLLKPEGLSARWEIPLTTLSQWRWNGKGPTFMKLGRHIVYRIQDIERFEEKKLRQHTASTMWEFIGNEQE